MGLAGKACAHPAAGTASETASTPILQSLLMVSASR
jgi:hypothetical protein